MKTKRQLKIWEKQQKENAAKRFNKALHTNQSPFRYAERTYKSRLLSKDDLDAIVHFTDIETLNSKETQEILVRVQLKHDLRELSSLFGCSSAKWKKRHLDAFVMKNVPGLIIIPNPFTSSAQRSIIKSCLRDYAKPPHKSNLDGHYHVPAEGIWPRFEKEAKGLLKPGDPDYYIPMKVETEEENGMYPTDIANDDDAASTVSSMYSVTTSSVRPLPPSVLLKKQRWVTLGYQYHWGTKKYNLDEPIPVPEKIAELMKAVATATENVGYDEADAALPWKNKYMGKDFIPEAGIINYYQLQSTLMCHQDSSEINMEAPLISLSLGHSCIYLIGGNTRDTKPIPLRLNSGDILVMTAVARKAYHGVPRILEGTLPDYLKADSDYDDFPDWKLFGDYMSTTRINLNIRQVFYKNKDDGKDSAK
ncbi:hypothetical protein BDF20DRAFT_906067 [Mycotypha africana]|uniref:uncharacterized protein n=1 Tax=Mycotypha africana TaxID=64632 RepID=UPI00230037B6|nr:uncharacterized protein BDF20DRAFT_906067 [Mycotypha africana]KAI8979409.1 hypothetical protein BDF20DRAFT_906067 [Mycotypha africana]